MRTKRDNDSKMFQLSYDAIKENSNLKIDLTWNFLQFDINAYLDSPTQSTIIIESNRTFNDWAEHLTELQKSIYYVFSEVAQKDNQFLIEDFPRPDDTEVPYVVRVERIRSEINKYRRNLGLKS